MAKKIVIIKETHRGLWYEDGAFKRLLTPGRYDVPVRSGLFNMNKPIIEIMQVDVRERELTIKGQEILTADKVAIRVSIIVQFRVVDPAAAVNVVENYEDRLYSDVQLSARRSLASTTLEEILTNRNRLSEDILAEVKETAARYRIAILRADVKDIVFPGNLQEIMNRVLAAERMSEAQLVEARTKAQTQQIEAQARAEILRLEADSQSQARRVASEADAAAQRVKTDADIAALLQSEKSAAVYASNPALLRLRELDALKELPRTATARIYIGFDKHHTPDGDERA